MGKMKAYMMDLEDKFIDEVSTRIGGCEVVHDLLESLENDGCMDLIAQVAAAEEIQLAQIKANAAAVSSSGIQAQGAASASAAGPSSNASMGAAIGSDLSTEVRVFVFGWAEPM